MTKEESARIHQLEQAITQMEIKASSLNDDIEYMKQKLAILKIKAFKNETKATH